MNDDDTLLMTSAREDDHASLGRCRAVIDAIDTELLALLSKRVRIARTAATLKQSLGLPLQSPEREREVLTRVEAAAAELPVDARTRIFRLVIDETLATERAALDVRSERPRR